MNYAVQRDHTRNVLQNQPYQRLGDYDLIQPCDMWMDELSVVVYLSSQVRIIFLGRL
jgi:hypothetical protein